MPLTVNEIFHSIQGESLYSGLPCTFIRLTGCNLRCSYCDTDYAFIEGTQIEINDILSAIKRFNCNIVEITGGEPLLQDETPELAENLIAKGYTVLIETNGSIDTSPLGKECIKIVDIKCPGSNESGKNDYLNISRLSDKDQLKFVIQTIEDYHFAVDILKRYSPGIPPGNILFSPCTGKLKPSSLAKWIIEDGLNVRFHLQMHKTIWPTIERGV